MPPSHSIFISYRRSDSSDITGRIYDYLEDHFGKDVVFKDVDAIPHGADFQELLNRTVGRCQVLIAVIGNTWLDELNKRNQSLTMDWVREEIELAVKNGTVLIPILVSGATMPSENELSGQLSVLARRHAARARTDPDFRNDMRALIRSLEQVIGSPQIASERNRARNNESFTSAPKEESSAQFVRAAVPKKAKEQTTARRKSVPTYAQARISQNIEATHRSGLPKVKNHQISQTVATALTLGLLIVGIGISGIAVTTGSGMGLLAWAVLGLMAGAIARAIYPGEHSLGIIGTMLLGIIGALVGGFLYALIGGGGFSGLSIGGIVVAVVGAILTLFIYYAVTKRS